MDITPDGRYLLYRIADDFEVETHLLVDLKSSLISISQLVTSFGELVASRPPAFVDRAFELTARLEDEAAILLDDGAVSDALDEWEEENPGKAFCDRLTDRPFDATLDVALLTGEDLLELFGSAPPEWDYRYSTHLRIRVDETGNSVYVLPLVSASPGDYKGETVEFHASCRQPWSKMIYPIAHFAGVP